MMILAVFLISLFRDAAAWKECRLMDLVLVLVVCQTDIPSRHQNTEIATFSFENHKEVMRFNTSTYASAVEQGKVEFQFLPSLSCQLPSREAALVLE